MRRWWATRTECSALQFAFPIAEETLQLGKVGRQIILLPDIQLQQAGMIGKVIVDFGRGQAVAFHLQAEFLGDRGSQSR
jgi:hypothetical protein